MIVLRRMFSNNEEQREYGVKSAMLGIITPGAYQAKEAAKYGYDEDEYKKVRGKYALKGLFTPGTATYIKKKVQKMKEEGKSKEEIKKYLENSSAGRIAAGIGEVGLNILTGGKSHLLTAGAAYGTGLYDKVAGNRGFKKNKKKED